MSFLTGLVAGFLSLYLAFANVLADGLLALAPPEESTPATLTAPETPTDKPLSNVESDYEIGGSIPDILIQNAAYQSAAVSQASYPTATAAPGEAIVNIFCTWRTATEERTTTGTGFFIHPDGVILTNAHVAQFLLLANLEGSNGECVIRTGNPATPRYTVDLLYISPAWLRQNASLFNKPAPKGTGERDYALLYVNGGLNNQPMPRVFPAVSFDTDLLRTSAEGSVVTAAGYPTDSLRPDAHGTVTLIPQVATTTITELMTFGSNYADLMTIGGTAVGKNGASGGPVVNEAGNAIGMIVTRGDDEQFGAGSLRAIAISNIDRTITEETGYSLLENLTGNLPYRANLYKKTMIPFLEQVLRWELQ